MADTTIASVVQLLPPVKSTPAPARSGTAGRSDTDTAAPHVEQARLIGSESSIATVTRQTNIAKEHGVALYQTVQEAVTPQEASKSDGTGYRQIDLIG